MRTGGWRMSENELGAGNLFLQLPGSDLYLAGSPSIVDGYLRGINGDVDVKKGGTTESVRPFVKHRLA